ncbi:fimbrial protein [Pseudomonas putida]|uniref:fimbrial protein n=1 Tax=Pseudomonas putida TaxID=303 RepID=UPI0018D79C10|nr:fimbrial protein [Pseudomonas putida]MBH3411719.1 type 1 fimbrial protein [Pseudomonas putida]
MIKFTPTTLALGMLLGLAWPAEQALANTDKLCFYYDTRSKPSLTYEADLQTQYVPLNASIGTEFGNTPVPYVFPREGRSLYCYHDGSVVMRFRMTPIRPPLMLARSGGPGEVLATNVEGIGARILLSSPFSGEATADFIPEEGHSWVPFTAIRATPHGLSAFDMRALFFRAILVKTAPLAPGRYTIDSDMFIGNLDYANFGDVFKFRLKAEVIQSQCTVGADPVEPNPVPLGEFPRSHFSHIGYTTEKVNFRITLAACQTDPENNTYATLELNSEDAMIGPGLTSVFGLTRDSQAAGVGIEVFKGDGTPMPLNTEVPMTPLNNGNTIINLKAAFHQTEPSHKVRPGLAKGQLNFIVRYR